MQIICKNCGHIYSGQFCNNCGQPSDTHKLNLHFIWHDLQHAFLHFDKGVLFTAKELFTRPGNSIREFIEGKRVKHFKPISLVIILATLYGVLRHLFHFSVLDNAIPIYNQSSSIIARDFNQDGAIDLLITSRVTAMDYGAPTDHRLCAARGL
mgnify:CR=1 FL=1